MRKINLFLAATAIALCSCSNDETLEVNTGKGIAFNVTAGKSQRATVITTSTIGEFQVFGYSGTTTFMNANVKKDGDKWSYSPVQFWPNEGTIDFYSVYPCTDTTLGGTISITADAQQIKDFTVNSTCASQVDLLYAVNKGCTKADNETTGVPVNFRHALSQIVFKAKNTNSTLRVNVQGVEVVNVANKGTFTYPAATTAEWLSTDNSTDTETDNTWGSWELTADKVNFVADITANTAIPADATDLTTVGSPLLLLPQTITPWDTTDTKNDANGCYFLVKCKIYNKAADGGETLLWPETDAYANVAVPATAIDWKQGKKYIYTFIFGEGGGYVPPTEEEDPSEPVLVPISFTVTVDEFQSADEIEVK